MEPEFYRMLPKEFTVHVARLKLKSVTVEDLAEMERKIEEEASKLADANVSVIGYGCTSGSLFKGLGHELEIKQRIEKASGKPAVATAEAVIKALKSLKIKKIAVATPYMDEINRLERRFLALSGFEIIDFKGLGLSSNLEIGRVNRKTLLKLVLNLNYKGVDGIFISCTNLPTIDIIEELEAETKKPVISSNTATLWAMLKKAGTLIRIRGYGTLLRRM